MTEAERNLVFILCGYIVMRFLEYKGKQKFGHLFERVIKPKVKYSGRELSGLPIEEYTQRFPKLPKSLDHQIDVLSFADSSVAYSVNLHRLTCTCPDFANRRERLEHSDPARLCKHMVLALYLLTQDEDLELDDRGISESIISDNLKVFLPVWAFGKNLKAG